MVCRGHEAGAQGVHLLHGADSARVAVVVGVDAPGEAGAGGRLHGNEAVVALSPQFLPHEG